LTFQSFDLDLIKVILETKQVDGTNFDIYIMTTINISTCKEHNRLILNISHLLTLKPLVSSRTPGMTWNINYCATGRQKHHIFNCFPLLNIKFDTLLMLVIDVLFFYVFSETWKQILDFQVLWLPSPTWVRYLLNDKTNALACKAKEQLTQKPLLRSEVNLIQQMKSDCNRRKTIKHLHYEIFSEFHCTYL
jgi:hypothetical protein